MASSLFGSSPRQPQRPQMNNPMQMLQAFAQFKQQMAGKDPQAMVKQLLDSGQMSREQFDQLSQQAQSLSGILK